MTIYPSKATGLVYRALRGSLWIHKGDLAKPTTSAYVRRKPSPEKAGDPSGISFSDTPRTAVMNVNPHGVMEICCESVCSLRNEFDNISLETEWDDASHGNIKNVPYYDEEGDEDQLKEANRLAAELVNVSTVVLNKADALKLKATFLEQGN